MKKKLSQNPLPARARCFANPKKDQPPKKQKHTDFVQGSEWSVVGFLPTNERRGAILLEEKHNYQ